MAIKNKGLSLTIKGLVVGALVLLLMIPSVIISEMIRERADRQREVAREVSNKWAGEQTLTGPILAIPYLETTSENIATGLGVSTVKKQVKKTCYVLPEQLCVQVDLTPQERQRSIFKIIVYQGRIDVEGSFAPVDFAELGIEPGALLPQEARICFGLGDLRGVEKQLDVVWDGAARPLTPGLANEMILSHEATVDMYDKMGSRYAGTGISSGAGLSAPVVLDPAGTHTFRMKIDLRGSREFNVTPVGKSTDVKVSSAWPDPSFRGMFLPNNPAEVSDEGFTAQWKVLYMNRNYPQSWTGEQYDIRESDLGVELLQPVDTYAKTTRAVKYSILFIALTFAVYFLLEIIRRRTVHPLQYILVGLALCLFYALLLSIGEYTGFNWAYLIASAATVGLISWYSYAIFQKTAVALQFGIVLAMLYGFIFILLQLQDGALLLGSIGLFVILAAIMFYSRKVDWQNEQEPQPPVRP